MNGHVRRAGRVAVRIWTSGGSRWLVCLPPAGGSSVSFRALADHLGPGWTVVAVDPPGHGSAAGPLCTDVGEIAEAVLDGLSALAVPPYVLLGHSVGGLTALRVAAAERTPVAAVVVCATPPPDAGPSLRFDVGLTDADLLTALAPLGGVSELLITVPRLLSALMPVLRADLAAFNAEMDAWRSGSALRAPAVPLIAVGAADDAFLPLAVFNHWRTSFPAAHVRSVPGRHFFPQDQPAPLAAILEEVHPPAAGDFVLTSGG